MTTLGRAVRPLDESVRRALAWYPREWRERHGEAMTGVLLDVVGASATGRLPRAQRLDLARNGLAQRLVGWAPARLRSLAASSALLGATAFSIFHLVLFEWEPWRAPAATGTVFAAPFSTASAYVDLAWLAAALLFLCGLERTARVGFAAVGIGALAMFAARYGMPGAWPHPVTLIAFAIAALFVTAGGARRPQHSGVAVLLVLGALAAQCAAYWGLSPLGYWGLDFGRHVDEQLWHPYTTVRVAGLAVFVALVAVAVALIRSGRRDQAAAAVACALPWAMLWSIYFVYTIDFIGPIWSGTQEDWIALIRHISELRWAISVGVVGVWLIMLGLLRSRTRARVARQAVAL